MTNGFDHPLRKPLSDIDFEGDPNEVVEQILKTLAVHGVIQYRGPRISLLSAPGRVLVDVVCHPDTTLREAAVRLGTTESTVVKQMTSLVKENLIERTRVGSRNHYKMNLKSLLSHPDSAGLIQALMIAAETGQSENGDSTV